MASDGSPCGGHLYDGKKAKQHTIASIDSVRKMGIGVMSISLVPSVVESNDEIYGRNFNLRGYGEHLNGCFVNLTKYIASL
jgi:nitric oxide reductase activation protein